MTAELLDAGALVPAAREPAQDTGLDLDAALRRARIRLERFAAARLRDRTEAEEVVQEALARAVQHRRLFATDSDLVAWATVVTSRLIVDRYRDVSRTAPVAELPEGARATRDTADVVVARDEARTALQALDAMPARQAAVLWARDVEGQSYEVIGRRYGLSDATVRSLLHRARRTLRREFHARGGSVPVAAVLPALPWLRGLRALGRRRGGVGKAAGAVLGTSVAAVAVAAAVQTGLAPGVSTSAVLRPAAVQHSAAVVHLASGARVARPARAGRAPVGAPAQPGVGGGPAATAPTGCAAAPAVAGPAQLGALCGQVDRVLTRLVPAVHAGQELTSVETTATRLPVQQEVTGVGRGLARALGRLGLSR